MLKLDQTPENFGTIQENLLAKEKVCFLDNKRSIVIVRDKGNWMANAIFNLYARAKGWSAIVTSDAAMTPISRRKVRSGDVIEKGILGAISQHNLSKKFIEKALDAGYVNSAFLDFAIKENDSELAKKVLEKRGSMTSEQQKVFSFESAINACLKNTSIDPKIVNAIVENANDSERKTLAHKAIEAENVSFLDALDKDILSEQDEKGFAPIHLLCCLPENDTENDKTKALFNCLLAKGVNIHATSKDGFTPLYTATALCNTKVALLLLDKNADVGLQLPGDSAMAVAISTGNVDLVKAMLVNKNVMPKDIAPFVDIALASSNVETLQAILPEKITNEEDAAFWMKFAFATDAHMAILDTLIERLPEGINTRFDEKVDENGKVIDNEKTLLHLATLLVSTGEEGDRIIGKLIEKNPQLLCATDSNKILPFLQKGTLHKLRSFLQKLDWSVLDTQMDSGKTIGKTFLNACMHQAAWITDETECNVFLDSLKLFLEKKPELFLLGNEEFTPLDIFYNQLAIQCERNIELEGDKGKIVQFRTQAVKSIIEKFKDKDLFEVVKSEEAQKLFVQSVTENINNITTVVTEILKKTVDTTQDGWNQLRAKVSSSIQIAEKLVNFIKDNGVIGLLGGEKGASLLDDLQTSVKNIEAITEKANNQGVLNVLGEEDQKRVKDLLENVNGVVKNTATITSVLAAPGNLAGGLFKGFFGLFKGFFGD